jgi:Cu-Zn family superoxide dismutase
MKRLPLIVIVTMCGTSLLGCISAHGAEKVAENPAVKSAVCVVRALGNSGVEGGVTFTQQDGFVQIEAEITGLTPGLHGFHVHEYGDCTMEDGTCAGGHYNPTNMPHGGPDSAKRHVGDLGNIKADKDGVAKYQRNDKLIQLNGPHSIIGRSIIIHANADDLTSQPSGNAGSRIACGVIGIAKAE